MKLRLNAVVPPAAFVLCCSLQWRIAVDAGRPVMTPTTPADLRHPIPQRGADGQYARPFPHREDCRDGEDLMGTHCLDYRNTHTLRLSKDYWISCQVRVPKDDDRLEMYLIGKVRRLRGACPEGTICIPHVPPDLVLAAALGGLDENNHVAIVKWAQENYEDFAATRAASRWVSTENMLIPRIDCIPKPRRKRKTRTGPESPQKTKCAKQATPPLSQHSREELIGSTSSPWPGPVCVMTPSASTPAMADAIDSWQSVLLGTTGLSAGAEDPTATTSDRAQRPELSAEVEMTVRGYLDQQQGSTSNEHDADPVNELDGWLAEWTRVFGSQDGTNPGDGCG